VIQKAGWEEAISKLEDKLHEAIISLLLLIESVNDQVIANIHELWEGSGSGVGQRVFISVSNTLEELGIFASFNIVVSIEVHLLIYVFNNVLALLVRTESYALNITDEAVVSGSISFIEVAVADWFEVSESGEGIEPVSTEHHGTEKNFNTHDRKGVVEQVIIDSGSSNISVAGVVVGGLVIGLIIVLIEEVNQLFHAVSQRASDDPGNNGEDHKENEMLDSLDHINCMTKRSLSKDSLFAFAHLLGKIVGIIKSLIGDSGTPPEEPDSPESLPEAKAITEPRMVSVDVGHTLGEVDGGINDLNGEVSSNAKGREEVDQRTSIDDPLWTENGNVPGSKYGERDRGHAICEHRRRVRKLSRRIT